MRLVIPAEVNGPPDSANGGYACGVVAGLLDVPGASADAGAAVQATLRRPPPLGRPLRGEVDGDRATLHDGDTLIGEASFVEAATSGTPEPISFDDARAVADGFGDERYFSGHPFPSCFTCGPERTGVGTDGLRIFPGKVASHLVVWPWTPEAALARPGSDGLVDAPYVWAALDCPSGLCWWHDDPDAPPHVLGRMAATVHRRPAPGEPLVVAGWSIAADGRKRRTGSVIWDAAGAVVADNRSTWIALDDRTAATFRPANRPT